MKTSLRRTLAIAIAALMAGISVAPSAFAADAMHGDAMHKTMRKHKGDAMQKHDAMHKDSMKKDADPEQ